MLVLVLAGCSSTATPNAGEQSGAGPRTHYPVTIENCGSPVVFDRAPTRVATSDVVTAEDMIALGLERSIVDSFRILADEQRPASEPKRFAAALRTLPEYSREEITLERLAAVRPEVVFAGWWNYGLLPGTEETPAALARHGIKTLALSESCAQVQPHKRGVSVQDTYRDISNLGVIFDVQGRAAALIAQMKTQIAVVHAKVAKLPTVSVFLYENDSSDPVTALGLGTPTALFEQAGGRNIFADKKRTWTAVSWQHIVERKPQCILIDDYAEPSWQQKEKTIETYYPAMRSVPAVRNHCFLHLPYDMLAPGPRNAEAVEAIARWLHPQAFGLPARP